MMIQHPADANRDISSAMLRIVLVVALFTASMATVALVCMPLQ
jgi:hypothetical protein